MASILTPAVHHALVVHAYSALSARDTFSGDYSLVEVSVAFVSAISAESSAVLSSETFFAAPGHFLSSVSTIPLMGHLAASFAGGLLALAVLVEKKVYQIHSSTFQIIAGRAKHATQSIFLMILKINYKLNGFN